MLSTVLRFTESGMSSLYRLTAPISVMVIFVKAGRKFTKDILIFSLIMGYSLLVSFVFYQNLELNLIGQGIYLFFLWVIIKSLKFEQDFDRNFFDFINVCTIITIIMAWLQLFTDYMLPHTTRMSANTACVFFHNENEFSEAVGCMFVIYAFLILIKKEMRYIPLAISILLFAFINDAKLSLIGDVVALIILFIYRLRFSCKKKMGNKTFFSLFILLIITTLVALYVFDIKFKFRDYTISIRRLFFEPINNIRIGYLVKGGSIQDRTNAIICGIKELVKTYGFGIGFGNSVVMMQKPEYRPYFYNASSMHNILAQVLVELGFVAMFFYYKIIKKIVFYFGRIKPDNNCLLKCAFAIGFIFLSAQSSVGILSNYYTWTVALYIVFVSDNIVKGTLANLKRAV